MAKRNAQGILSGKTVIVTGASRGIGEACVRGFVAEGAKVAIFDLPQERDAGEELSGELGSSAEFFACDVTVAAQCETAVKATNNKFGPVTTLVNNAGIAIAGGLEEMPESDWDKIFSVNVKGIYLVSRHVIGHMRASGGGSIINMASESAFIGFAMHPAYCASKAAVVHLTRSMAVRYAPDNIRVNSLCPGTIDTALYRGFLATLPNPDEVHQQVLDKHPLGLGQPEDISAAALFLASDSSRYMTGSPMLVDGGSTAL